MEKNNSPQESDPTSLANQAALLASNGVSLYSLLDTAPVAFAVLMGQSLVIDFISHYNLQIWQCTRQKVIGKPLSEVFPGRWSEAKLIHQQVYQSGQRQIVHEIQIDLPAIDLSTDQWTAHQQLTDEMLSSSPAMQTRWFNALIDPIRNEHGQMIGQLATYTEVTEQVRARRKVEDSRQQLLIATEAAGLGYWDLNPQSGELIWSDRCRELFSLPVGAPVTLDVLMAGLHPDDRELIATTIKTTTQPGSNGKCDVEYRTIGFSDGRLRWIQTKGKAFFDSQGICYKLAGTVMDITEEKQVVLALRESEERYATTIYVSELGLWDFDVVNQTLVGAGKIAQIYGLKSNEEYDIVRVFERIHPDDRSEQEQLYTSILTGKVNTSFTTSYRIIREDTGAVRWIKATAYAFFNQEGSLCRTVGTVVDVTEQHMALQALRTEQRFTKSLIEASTSLIYIYAINTQKNEFVSPQIVDILGYTPDQITDMGADVLGTLFHPDDMAITQERFTRLVTEDKDTIYEVEYRMRHKDGLYVWLLDRGRVFQRDEQNKAIQILGVVTDISQRKELEEKIRKQFYELNTIYQTAPIGLAMIDPSYRFVRINERLAEINGLPAQDHIGRFIGDIVPDLAEQAEAVFRQVFNIGQPILNVEFTGQTNAQPGVERIWNESWFPIKNEQGETFAVSVVVEEITGQRQDQQALQASEDRYQNFIHRSTEGIWRFEVDHPIAVHLPVAEQIERFFADGYLAECNDAMAQMYGYTQARELIGKRLCDFFPDDADSEAYFSYFISSGYQVHNAESKEVDRQGQTRYFSNNLLGIVENGKLVRAWGTQRDITDQRIAEEKIREREARFRILAETLPQMIWVANAQGHNEYLSPQWQQYCGIDQPIQAWQYMIHPEDKQASDAAYQNAFSAGYPFRTELRLRNRQGEYRWHLSIAEPVRDALGTIIRWVGAISDIHERKTFAQTLEQQVAERTAALAAANEQLARSNEELAEANEELERFAYVASHDLQEPLRKVTTFTRMVAQSYGYALDEAGRNLLERTEAAAARMRALIQSLLDYSRIGYKEETFAWVDLNQLLELALSDLEINITEQAAQVQVGPLPTVWAEPTQMQQLLTNLISNALKFKRAGVRPLIVIVSGLASEEELIRFKLSLQRRYIRIQVSDNGIGFETEYAEHIFEPFRRLHGQKDYAGSGIGLAICRKIVVNHSGVIYAQGSSGQGAVFTVLLPTESPAEQID